MRSAELCSADKAIYSRWGFAPKNFILISAKFLSAHKFDVVLVGLMAVGATFTPNECFCNGKVLRGDHVVP